MPTEDAGARLFFQRRVAHRSPDARGDRDDEEHQEDDHRATRLLPRRGRRRRLLLPRLERRRRRWRRHRRGGRIRPGRRGRRRLRPLQGERAVERGELLVRPARGSGAVAGGGGTTVGTSARCSSVIALERGSVALSGGGAFGRVPISSAVRVSRSASFLRLSAISSATFAVGFTSGAPRRISSIA